MLQDSLYTGMHGHLIMLEIGKALLNRLKRRKKTGFVLQQHIFHGLFSLRHMLEWIILSRLYMCHTCPNRVPQLGPSFQGLHQAINHFSKDFSQ